MDSNMSRKRVLYFDLLNIAACFAVITLHCNQMVHTWQPGGNWLLALGIEVAFYWAVPIFFMLTGATLLDYRSRYDTRIYLIKRFKRTVIPFLFWSLVFYLLVSVGLQGAHLGARTFLNMTLNTEIEGVYWFFIPLFSIYLSLPLLSLAIKHEKALAYGVVTSFLLQGVFPYISAALNISWNGGVSIPGMSGMLVYAGMGYLLANCNLDKKQRYLLYAAAILTMAFRYIYTALSSAKLGYLDRLFFTYSAFPAVIQGAAIFVLFKQLDTKKIDDRCVLAIRKVSACSFGIYLIHKPILDQLIINDSHGLGVPMESVTLRTMGTFALYVLCLIIVLTLKKIPLLRKFVP